MTGVQTCALPILIRYIEKEVKDENVFPIYTKVHGAEPSFNILYQITIEDIISKKEIIINQIKKHLGEETLTVKNYIELFEEEDLGKCVYEAFSEGTNRAFAEKWLKGQRLLTDEIKSLKLINQNDSDYARSKTLQNLIEVFLSLFSSVALFVDQLEECSAKLARTLSDVFREYLDAYPEKFVLVCSLQASQEEDWYGAGFTDALLSRLKYSVTLPGFTEDSMVSFLTKHHNTYSGSKKLGLFPYTEEGLRFLFKMTLPERRYPRFLFTQSAFLAKKMIVEDKSEITEEFVKSQLGSLEYVSSQSRVF